MTLMSSISKLTTSVDQLTGEANVTKAQLDAKVALADAAVVATQAEQAATEGYRDEAAAHAADAATHLATVKAGVTYQGIGAILAEKALTAVDVFVYDTSLDSDGGAWRNRCQHTSWYNEELSTATRGSRREFPTVAMIVVEADKVTIYDGDDPALPMWMVFLKGSVTGADFLTKGSASNVVRCASALNGYLSALGTFGGFIANFASDFAKAVGPSGLGFGRTAIADRNGNGINMRGGTDIFAVVDWLCNDVAMTVLPDAPVDPATGLPVPTIAVATNGGVSVLRQDGTVVNSGSTGAHPSVAIIGNSLFYQKSGAGDPTYRTNLQGISGGFGTHIFDFNDGSVFPARIAAAGSDLAIRSDRTPFGVSRMMLNGSGAITAEAHIKSRFSTGWMPGAIRGAWLADTDEGDLVGSGELVTNGTFDTDSDWTKGTGWTIADGVAYVSSTAAGTTTSGDLIQTVTTEVGKNYVFSFTAVGTGNFRVLFPTFADLGPGSHTLNFTATSTSTTISMRTQYGAEGYVDNVSVKLADADRSANNKGLIVNGTITRSPVADGAELVGYSGFDFDATTNYLSQPYNSAFAFGAGDFCIMWWNRQASIQQNRRLLGIYDPVGSTVRLGISISVSGGMQALINNAAAINVSSGAVPSANAWDFFCLTRADGVMALYRNGVTITSAANTTTINTAVTDELRIGGLGALGPNGNSLALLRISATAPTPDQIAKIYEDERKLFMPGAKCTLYGTSDAVTALAHDPKTNLLHVGTSQGRSVFDGLQRVANTETPVGTAISAVNGLIVEE